MTPAEFLIDGVLVLTFLAGAAFFARGVNYALAARSASRARKREPAIKHGAPG